AFRSPGWHDRRLPHASLLAKLGYDPPPRSATLVPFARALFRGRCAGRGWTGQALLFADLLPATLVGRVARDDAIEILLFLHQRGVLRLHLCLQSVEILLFRRRQALGAQLGLALLQLRLTLGQRGDVAAGDFHLLLERMAGAVA